MKGQPHILYDIQLDPLDAALADVRAGRFVILLDDPGREGEGDLVAAAAAVRPDMINFMITQARGAFVAVFMPPDWADRFNLPVQIDARLNQESQKTNFRLTCDSAHGFSGCSTVDRAQTVNILGGTLRRYRSPTDNGREQRTATANDLVRPGHVVPIATHPKGLNGRQGHTEAGMTLMQMAGIDPPVAVDMEILDPSGSMAKPPYLKEFAKRHGLKIIAIQQILSAMEDASAAPGMACEATIN